MTHNVEMDSHTILPWLCLHASGLCGPKTLWRMHQEGLTPIQLLQMPTPQIPSSLQRLAIRANTANILAKKIYQYCINQCISIIHPDSPLYPSQLRLSGAPYYPILFAQGNAQALTPPSVAIVGTRSPSHMGQLAARHLSSLLANLDFTVTSGLAEGIDSCAHQSCLDAQGITIAVLGCGLPLLATQERNRLAHSILNRGGCLVSPFPPGQSAKAGTFVSRNRLIALLAQATIIIESRLDGGAMHTARFCREANRPLLAVPGSPLQTTSQGPHYLLRTGQALPLWTLEDVSQLLSSPNIHRSIASPAATFHTDSALPAFLEKFQGTEIHFQTLLSSSGEAPGKLISILTQLEIQGLATPGPGGIWKFPRSS